MSEANVQNMTKVWSCIVPTWEALLVVQQPTLQLYHDLSSGLLSLVCVRNSLGALFPLWINFLLLLFCRCVLQPLELKHNLHLKIIPVFLKITWSMQLLFTLPFLPPPCGRTVFMVSQLCHQEKGGGPVWMWPVNTFPDQINKDK